MHLLLLSMAHAGPCAEPTTQQGVASRLDAAEASFADVEIERFLVDIDLLALAVSCLDERLEPPLVARLHRADGMRAFVLDDVEGARRSFAAARAAGAGERLPERFAPELHVLHEHYTALPPGPGAQVAVPLPDDTYLRVDGVVATALPRDLPAIVQVKRGSSLESTVRVPAGAPFSVLEVTTDDGRGPRGALTIAAGVGLGLTAGAAVLGIQERARFQDGGFADPDEAVESWQRTNTWFGASLVAGATTTGLLVGVWVL